MKNWKNKLVPILFALAGLLSLVPVAKQLIKEESVNGTFLVIAVMFFVLGFVFLVVGRKSGAGSGQPIA